MKKRKIQRSAIVAVIAGVITVFIARSNDEPSSCFTWKVEINESPFYLAGSVHTAREDNYPLQKAYMKSYKKANKTIFELEDDFDALEKKIFQYAKKDRLMPDQYLNLHMDSAVIEKLKQVFDENTLNQYFQHEAWLLNMAIAGSRSKLIGYDPLLAIDEHFHKLAEKDGKKIIGLDSIETQLLLFEFEAPYELQVKIIAKAVHDMESMASNETSLYEAYFKNDLTLFETEFLKVYDFNKPQIVKIYDQVFSDRNLKWIERFEQLSIENPGSYFVLVGAGHFFGPNNIRELLEDKGYTVEKL